MGGGGREIRTCGTVLAQIEILARARDFVPITPTAVSEIISRGDSVAILEVECACPKIDEAGD